MTFEEACKIVDLIAAIKNLEDAKKMIKESYKDVELCAYFEVIGDDPSDFNSASYRKSLPVDEKYIKYWVEGLDNEINKLKKKLEEI